LFSSLGVNMKLLARWGAILGIASASLIGPSIGRQMSALALPEPQVMQILSSVPMFMITNAEGKPLAATVPNPQDKTKQIQVYSFFVNPQDAQQVVESLRTSKPDVGRVARVTPTALSGVVQFAMQNAKQPNSTVGVEIVPNRAQLNSAIEILRQSGTLIDKGGQLTTKDGKPFQVSTPVFFVADSKTSNPLGAETTVKENGQDKKVRFVPFYFNRQEAQTVLEQSRKQDPALASSTKIDVVMLDTVVATLMNSNDPTVSQFQLVPSRESIEFIKRQPNSGGRPAAPTAPGTRPPATAPSAAPTAPTPAPTAPVRPKP
jgi:hypothetical protein